MVHESTDCGGDGGGVCVCDGTGITEVFMEKVVSEEQVGFLREGGSQHTQHRGCQRGRGEVSEVRGSEWGGLQVAGRSRGAQVCGGDGDAGCRGGGVRGMRGAGGMGKWPQKLQMGLQT